MIVAISRLRARWRTMALSLGRSTAVAVAVVGVAAEADASGVTASMETASGEASGPKPDAGEARREVSHSESCRGYGCIQFDCPTLCCALLTLGVRIPPKGGTTSTT